MAPSSFTQKAETGPGTFDNIMGAIQKSRGAAFALLWGFTLALVLIWDQNTVSIVASAFGVVATLQVVFGLRWWRGVAAVASALFVVNWALAFVFIDIGGPLLKTYWSGLRGAMQRGAVFDSAVVLSYEVGLPLMHLIIALGLSIRLIKRQPLE